MVDELASKSNQKSGIPIKETGHSHGRQLETGRQFVFDLFWLATTTVFCNNMSSPRLTEGEELSSNDRIRSINE